MSFEHRFKLRLISLKAQEVLSEVNKNMKDFGFETDLTYGLDFGTQIVTTDREISSTEKNEMAETIKKAIEEKVDQEGVGVKVTYQSTKEI